MADGTLSVLGICGSLRKGSFNRMALNAAIEAAPDGMKIMPFEGLGEIPPYNEDVKEKGFPPIVEKLREQIRGSDAVLFVTPEYNYSVPGVLKNAFDWASRPPDQPFNGKPVGIMGASPGAIGTARAQYNLRQSCVFVNAFALNRPEVMIARAQDKFDKEGRLTDAATREHIAKFLGALVEWVRLLKK
ncbi:MAG: NADPH-dependent FMN reductase [Alphaproteobacteria bacterium]